MSSVSINLCCVLILMSLCLICEANFLEVFCKFDRKNRSVSDINSCKNEIGYINGCGNNACYLTFGDKCGEKGLYLLIHGKCGSGLTCCGTCIGCRNGDCTLDQQCSRYTSEELLTSLLREISYRSTTQL